MDSNDGFIIVRPGKKSRRNVNTNIHNVTQLVDIDIDETVERILTAKQDLETTEFMKNCLESLNFENIGAIYC